MNRFLMALLSVFVIGFSAKSQGEQPYETEADAYKHELIEVKSWIANHPEVKLVSLDHFLSVSSGERNELTALSQRLLHEGEFPRLEEITAYEQSGNTEGTLSMTELNTELNQVDDWVAQHPEIKFIPMTEFQGMSAQDRNAYMALPNVIIYTYKLRWEDIQAYLTSTGMSPENNAAE